MCLVVWGFKHVLLRNLMTFPKTTIFQADVVHGHLLLSILPAQAMRRGDSKDRTLAHEKKKTQCSDDYRHLLSSHFR